ncbi:MAG: penicillin-binding protein 2 [Aureispira sp.]|jgi:penicillin-binding protein 2
MQDLYQDRQKVLQIAFVICAIMLVFKCFQIQIWDKSYQQQHSYREAVTLYPSRGALKDRNGELMVYNLAMYDLKVTYNQVRKSNIDTMAFCELLGISDSTFYANMNKDFKDRRFSQRKPFNFLTQIPGDKFASIEERLYEFPGFESQLKSVRGYPAHVGAHMLGYISEVSPAKIKKSNGLYQRGEYIGTSGLELSYEEQLRGIRGVEHVLKDKWGKRKGKYKGGIMDEPAVSGYDLITSIDLELQAYGEQLMQNKIGAIVAIEPSTGEILAMISTPSYDPAILAVNRNRKDAFRALQRDSLIPLFNRALMAQYPPGSIFKTTLSAIGLQERILTPGRGMACGGGFVYGSLRIGCHGHGAINDVGNAIQYSCNKYYCQTFRELVNVYGFYYPEKGMDRLADHLHSWGLGARLGVDIPNEASGHVPTAAYYDKKHGKGMWKFSTAVSVGIGQGELLITPLQMANMTAIIANRGHYYIPHFAKEFEGDTTGILDRFKERHYTKVHPMHFEHVVNGMAQVVTAGTGARSKIPDIIMCGKTGTVENNKGKDHSTFIAFAPKDNPKIAIAVYVENGGFGSTYAAPISSLMIEKYIKGSIESKARKSLEKRILEADLIKRSKPTYSVTP